MDKNYLVTKSNSLIHSRYELSLEEQRIILTLATMVQPDDEGFKTYTMSVSDFAKLTNVDPASKYTKLKGITKKLMQKVFEIDDEEQCLQLHWLSSCRYVKKQGMIELKISDELKPYMLQLKEKFTSYYLRNILSMKSKYSVRMYEILKSNQFKGSFIIELDVLKRMLKCETYKQWTHIRTRIIEPSIKEINYYTDLFVDYKPIKSGRSINSIEFILLPDFIGL